MTDAQCIALVFSRSGYRYYNYACMHAVALLHLNKTVYIISPDWLKVQQYLIENYFNKKNQFVCIPSVFKNSPKNNIHVFSNLLGLRQSLAQTEKKYKYKTDLIIFCPVDDWFLANTKRWLIEKVINCKWTGIYLNLNEYYSKKLTLNVDPKPGEPDYFFSAKNCIGVVLIDRFMTKEVQSRVYKKVVVFPDISLRSNTHNNKVLNQIKNMAAGRMIVGMILIDDVDITPFLQTAFHAENDKYFFVCAGNIDPSALKPKARSLLSNILQTSNNNHYFVLNSFDDEEEITSFLQVFDVFYLKDGKYMQPHILLTKAAILRKPVIASTQDVIGKLVETFKLGICVKNDYLDDLQALNMLRLQMPFEKFFDFEKLKQYDLMQSNAMLEESMEELLLF